MKANDNKKLNVIDLFVGCGGLTEGFESSNLVDTIACVEWEKDPYNNLLKRMKEKWGYEDADKRVIRFDIQRVEELIYGWKDDMEYQENCGLDKLASEYRSIDLIIGGPPCQAYSIAGRINDANKMDEDYRNYLFESYIKIVDHFSPKAFVFENVEGMLSSRPGGRLVIDLIREGFENIGYDIVTDLRKNALIDVTDFGVPQKRKRIIILGIKKSSFNENSQILLEEFYNKILPSYHIDRKTTVRDSISDLPKLIPATSEYRVDRKKYSHEPYVTYIPNHIPRYHSKRDIEIFRDLALDIESGSNKYSSIESLKALYTERTGKTGNVHKYNVLKWDQPSNTIPAHLCKDGLRHIHPDSSQARTITVREAARLQTFPDDYEFIGSMVSQYKMIGNAVPPLFAECLAKAIYEFIKKYSYFG